METTQEGTDNNSCNEHGVFYREEYAKKDFWNDRFQNNKGFFDWYIEYKEFNTYLNLFEIDKQSKILMIGCGNSKLSEQMYNNGYTNITNIDNSDVVIKKMNDYIQSKNIPMEFIEMDALNMTFDNEHFDIIIDKGTLDALICGKNYDVTNSYLKEVMRVLKTTGIYLLVTHGSPEGRKLIFENGLDFENYTYDVCKQNLSSQSQLINIMRSELKDKPLMHILKDKNALIKSLAEFGKFQKQQKLASSEINIQRICYTEQDLEDEKNTEEQNKYIVCKSISNESENTQEQSNKNENEQINKQENQEQATTEQNQKGESTQSKTYNPQRQSYCFIYRIKKKN